MIALVDVMRRATIDAIQALNIRHVKLTGYDKAKTNWQTVSVSRHADSQLRGSASPVELTTHVKTLETHRESVSNFSHRYLPATTQPS
jgi:isopentenyl diphosphate isomerase/L-lactate dehydrogenase-like FMN-dependent dehydrogenase